MERWKVPVPDDILGAEEPSPSSGRQEERPTEPRPQPEEPIDDLFFNYDDEDTNNSPDNDANQITPNDDTNSTQPEEGPAQPRY
ncbi:unnamed protein product, partial [Anisakis simplex]|uniref:Serine protease n=1 Tax=Anisakis simplex TaxID=6269 RepID=A0A0M3JBJ7_ANISI